MASQPRPPITCHILDTVAGRPAAHVLVSLTLLKPATGGNINSTATLTFTSKTNSDGRVTSWSPDSSKLSLEEVFKADAEAKGPMTWSLRFDTGSYYGPEKTFYPEVEIKFFVRSTEEHYHVPLLLSPWSYTTYRGS